MEMKVNIESTAPDADENRGWVVVNVKMVLGLLGAGACLGWIAITLMAGPLFAPSLDIEFQSALAHVAFIAGLAAISALAAPLSDFWSAHRKAFLVMAFVLTVLGMAGALIGVSGESPCIILCSGFACGGIGIGILYTMYGEYLSSFFANGIEPYTHSVMLIAVCLVGAYFLISEEYRIAYWAVVAAIAFLGYLSQVAFYRVDKLPATGWKESRPRAKVQKRSYFATTTSGIMMGFAIGAVFTIGSEGQLSLPVASLIVVIACMLLLVDSLNKNVLGETVSMHWFLPITAILAFPILFVPKAAASVFAVLMVCFALFPTSCSISAICRHIHICDLAAIGQFGFGRFWDFAGILIGLCLSFVGFSQQFFLIFGDYGTIGAVIALVALVIISSSFVMVEDNYPSEERIHVVEDETGTKIVTVGPGTPIHALVTDSGTSSADDRPRVGTFQMKCAIVSEKYGLSKRQSEVLAMLARGRGTEYITEKLVISPHTAKAHTYNIYLKLDVHSRQELMDLVENTEVPDDAIERFGSLGA